MWSFLNRSDPRWQLPYQEAPPSHNEGAQRGIDAGAESEFEGIPLVHPQVRSGANLHNLRSLPKLHVTGISPYFWIALADDIAVHGRDAMRDSVVKSHNLTYAMLVQLCEFRLISVINLPLNRTSSGI